MEVEFANFQRQEMRVLTPEQKQQILQLGKDFPRLWKAPTTSSCDRKRMLRLLIRDITVVDDPDSKLLHWQGGATDTIEVQRRPKRADAIRYSDMFVAKIPFTLSMVRWIRFKHRIPGPSLSHGTLTANRAMMRGHFAYFAVPTNTYLLSASAITPASFGSEVCGDAASAPADVGTDGPNCQAIPTVTARAAPVAKPSVQRQSHEVGAECVSSARSDLCGGRPAMVVRDKRV